MISFYRHLILCFRLVLQWDWDSREILTLVHLREVPVDCLNIDVMMAQICMQGVGELEMYWES